MRRILKVACFQVVNYAYGVEHVLRQDDDNGNKKGDRGENISFQIATFPNKEDYEASLQDDTPSANANVVQGMVFRKEDSKDTRSPIQYVEDEVIAKSKGFIEFAS